MTDHGAPLGHYVPAPEVPDALDVPAELRRLAADYPTFRFRTQRGWDRTRLRWVAERVHGLDAGVHTVITTELSELRATLSAVTPQPRQP